MKLTVNSLVFDFKDSVYNIYLPLNENNVYHKTFIQKLTDLENDNREDGEKWSRNYKDGYLKTNVSQNKGNIDIKLENNIISTLFELKDNRELFEEFKCTLKIGNKWVKFYNGNKFAGIVIYIKKIAFS